jgi:hypothetical protein
MNEQTNKPIRERLGIFECTKRTDNIGHNWNDHIQRMESERFVKH